VIDTEQLKMESNSKLAKDIFECSCAGSVNPGYGLRLSYYLHLSIHF